MKFKIVLSMSTVLCVSSNYIFALAAKGKPFQELADDIAENTQLIEQNTANIGDMSGALSELKIEVERIDLDLSQLKDTVANNTQELVNANSRIDATVDDTDTLRAELKALVEKQKADIDFVNGGLYGIRLDLASLAALSANLAESLDDLVTTHADDISAISADIQQLNAILSMVNAKYITLSSTQATLSASVVHLSEMLAAFQLRLEGLTGQVSALEAYVYPNPAVFSENFQFDQASQASVDQAWDDFRASLVGLTFNRMEVTSSNGGSVACDSTQIVNMLAEALVSGETLLDRECNGFRWNVGTCGNTIELSANVSGSVCRCDTFMAVRPGLESNNPNWGGVGSSLGGVNGTCSAPTQTITVTFK
jgi:uncharacterized phage infection (PIP) family protein YhgE